MKYKKSSLSIWSSTRAGGAVLAAAALLAVSSPALAQTPAGPVLPPSGGVVYVTNARSGDVSSLAIGPGAVLRPLGKPVSTLGKFPRGIALTPDGATAYVVNSDSDTLSVFRVGAQGALQPDPQIVQTGDEPWGATVSPNGRTLYVTNTGDRTISAYRIGLDGRPSRLGDFRATSDNPKQTVLSPDGRFLYLSYAPTHSDLPVTVVASNACCTGRSAAVMRPGERLSPSAGSAQKYRTDVNSPAEQR